ncbi:protein canopy 4-like [Oscarella lobularis]|uniref:protein canopy 4-like n=1 Tax=Oscarella lobularis TaxID=121494 RepID=UPI0033140EE4
MDFFGFFYGFSVGLLLVLLSRPVKVEEATDCQVCRLLAIELSSALQKTGASSAVLETGSRLDPKGEWADGKKISYKKSEVRLMEALEGVCDSMLDYRVHSDKPEKFAKGRTSTMETLHNLKNKGVKVKMDLPEEMWDSVPAEITRLKSKCESLVKEYEDELTNWYFKHQDQSDLETWFCKGKVLSTAEQKCLLASDDNETEKDEL